eukprot:Em0015g1289a
MTLLFPFRFRVPGAPGGEPIQHILEVENSNPEQMVGCIPLCSRLVLWFLNLPVWISGPSEYEYECSACWNATMHMVKIGNPSRVQTLQLTSISSDSSDLHTSFFRSKIVKGGEVDIFNVVFLARTVGPVQSKLYISTSLGTFDYKPPG